jgi:SAM-dependent methyltransferase
MWQHRWPWSPRKKNSATPNTPTRIESFLDAATLIVSSSVSAAERMPSDDLAGYLATGRSGLRAVHLAQLAARKSEFTSILDMACGHGRVLRWLKAGYPDARLTACDVLSDGVDFCKSSFGATPIYSTPALNQESFPDRYDLIWVGSLLTHLDADQWVKFIQLWHDILAPDGVLVVTTHGELVAERMRNGSHYGYPATSIRRMLRGYGHAGFSFLEESATEIDYGISIAKPAWVIHRLLTHADFRLVLFSETLWANHQDVAAVVKRPLDPRIAERPE